MRMKKQMIMVLSTLILFIVCYIGCVEEKINTISYLELWEDVEFINGNASFTLTSYKDGDILYIKDKIINVSYGITRINDSDYPITTIYFNSEDELPPPLCFLEDKRSEYSAGNISTIPVYVKQYTKEDITVIWLEEWYNIIYLAGLIPPGPEITPIITFLKQDTKTINTLTVTSASPSDSLYWEYIELRINETTQDHGLSGLVTNGDIVNLTSIAGTGTYNASFWNIPIDAIIVRFEFMG